MGVCICASYCMECLSVMCFVLCGKCACAHQVFLYCMTCYAPYDLYAGYGIMVISTLCACILWNYIYILCLWQRIMLFVPIFVSYGIMCISVHHRVCIVRNYVHLYCMELGISVYLYCMCEIMTVHHILFNGIV